MDDRNPGRSMADYLEAIYVIRERQGYCLSTDVTKYLSFSKSSVFSAVRKLEESGYIQMDRRDILLTSAGLEIAQRIHRRYDTLKALLESIGVPAEVAEQDASALKHDLSEISCEKLCEKLRGSGAAAPEAPCA